MAFKPFFVFKVEISFCVIFLTSWGRLTFGEGKFSAETFSEISLLAKEGKFYLESLKEKASIPEYGTCWKNAISDLQLGCKFLSENVQSDLALRFTDCFLQMSGYEPVTCDVPKSVCLKKLSDRAFNAYTEFYTHTQSMCFFLQSQIWHEEAEKTINKLSSTSQQVSQKLEEAEKIQGKLLEQQKETLYLQLDLMGNSKNLSSALQSSQEKINNIMTEFQSTASEQKKLLLDMLENFLSFKLWAVDEISWFTSTVFLVSSTVIGFLFTSVSRTRQARLYVFSIFTLNYLFERYLTANIGINTNNNDIAVASRILNIWIWWCRKFCICLSGVVILYTAFNYYDYNFLNYNLLLEIKNQNSKILSYIYLQSNDNFSKSVRDVYSQGNKLNHHYDSKLSRWNINSVPMHLSRQFNQSTLNPTLSSTEVYSDSVPNSDHTFYHDIVDCAKNDNDDTDDNASVKSEKNSNSQNPRSGYNLRSSKVHNKCLV